MAGCLIKSSTPRDVGFLRLFYTNVVRRFSESAPSTTSTPSAKYNKSKKRKKKNLFEVLQFLPNWGIGYQLAKSHWVNVSYEITKINLYKDGRHGKAWGIVFKDGLQSADAAKKISGVHKRCWRYIPNSAKVQDSNSPPNSSQTILGADVDTA